jgi:hypothetical protein
MKAPEPQLLADIRRRITTAFQVPIILDNEVLKTSQTAVMFAIYSYNTAFYVTSWFRGKILLFGLCPSSGILKNREHSISVTASVSVFG